MRAAVVKARTGTSRDKPVAMSDPAGSIVEIAMFATLPVETVDTPRRGSGVKPELFTER